MISWIAENWTPFELLCLGSLTLFFGWRPALALALERRVCRALAPLTSRPWLAVLLPGLIPVLLRVLLLIFGAQAVPEPNVADEFSYLLGAETFAGGHLANAAHPFWEHFEAPFVLHQPSYASMYPPGQALALAAGTILFGSPWAGVLLGVAFFGCALAWMLRGWLPPGLALAGAVLIVLRLAGFGYWINSYWGGAVAAGAGALVLGAWPRLAGRIRHGVRVRDAVLLSIGLALLANTRPFEGVVLALPIGIALLLRLPGMGKSERKRLVLPVLLVLGTAAGLMGMYFQAITGDPGTMPYAVFVETYGVQPNFVWQELREPVAHANPIVADVFEVWFDRVLATHSWEGWIHASGAKLSYIGEFFFGPILGLALIGLPWLLLVRRSRGLLLVALIFVAGISLEVSFFPHYAAPASALFALLALQSLRVLRVMRRSRRFTGRAMAVGLLVSLTCVVFGRTAVAVQDLPVRFWAHPFDPWSQRAVPSHARHFAEAEFRARGGEHLVFLRYTAEKRHRVWAYNGADLDGAPILWAFERGGEADLRLIEALPGREVWLAWPDLSPPRVEPWPGR